MQTAFDRVGTGRTGTAGVVRVGMLLLAATGVAIGAPDRERVFNFDQDPGWDGVNNRPTATSGRPVQQEFGWIPPGGEWRSGAVGGKVTPAAEPAYYAMPIDPRSFETAFSASGVMLVGDASSGAAGAGNTLLGFFNQRTLQEWRTPSTVTLRINGRGDGFHAHVEYATAKWRAGADFIAAAEPKEGRRTADLLPGGKQLRWSLSYEPGADGLTGKILARVGSGQAEVNLEPGHRADGARFTRFGILNVLKSVDDPGVLEVGGLTVLDRSIDLRADPKWDARGNRTRFESKQVRPWFDFGYSPTRFAGGRARGEIGGRFYRGDERYPDKMAGYGARVGELSLGTPLRASGRIVLVRGVTDSTTLIGYYHSEGSFRASAAQKNAIPENFLGAAIEGPSRDGFRFYPLLGTDSDAEGMAGLRPQGGDPEPPWIYPDGRSHQWTMEYLPADGPGGTLRLTLDGRPAILRVPAELARHGARFNRFGFVTPHIDGNGQTVFVDDLRCTVRP